MYLFFLFPLVTDCFEMPDDIEVTESWENVLDVFGNINVWNLCVYLRLVSPQPPGVLYV